MDRKTHWEDVHSRRAEEEVSWFEANPGTSLGLVTENLPHDAAIVDIGAGSSRLADALLDAGFEDLTVLDISAAALERSKARLAARANAVHWQVADITAWRPERRFDAWHDRAVFHFLVDAADREAYRRALLKGTRLGSRVVIGTFAEDGPEKCSGLPVRRYNAEALAAELGEHFVFVKTLHEAHATPSGNVQNFRFSVFARH